jgi:hypothetical protein
MDDRRDGPERDSRRMGLLEAADAAKGKAVFLILLAVMAAVLAKGADFGGRMVYDY